MMICLYVYMYGGKSYSFYIKQGYSTNDCLIVIILLFKSEESSMVQSQPADSGSPDWSGEPSNEIKYIVGVEYFSDVLEETVINVFYPSNTTCSSYTLSLLELHGIL